MNTKKDIIKTLHRNIQLAKENVDSLKDEKRNDRYWQAKGMIKGYEFAISLLK